jgi:cyclase
VDVIVPGHGPLTDKAGVREVADYLAYINREARARYDAGLSAEDATRDIGLGRYASWKDAERIAVNVDTLYREFSGDRTAPNVIRLFGLMGQIYYDRR